MLLRIIDIKVELDIGDDRMFGQTGKAGQPEDLGRVEENNSDPESKLLDRFVFNLQLMLTFKTIVMSVNVN